MENGFSCMSESDALGTDCNQFIEKCNSEIELVNHLVTNICAQTCCLHNQKLWLSMLILIFWQINIFSIKTFVQIFKCRLIVTPLICNAFIHNFHAVKLFQLALKLFQNAVKSLQFMWISNSLKILKWSFSVRILDETDFWSSKACPM